MEKTGLNSYIEKILMALISSDNLVKLLHYNTPDALAQPNLSQEQKLELIYKNIYPFKFIPNVVDAEASYINISFTNFKQMPGSRVYQSGRIVFLINCHKNLWRTDMGLRPLCIFEEISKLFTNNQNIGLGRLDFSSSGECAYDSNLMGYYIAFDIVDFCNNIG